MAKIDDMKTQRARGTSVSEFLQKDSSKVQEIFESPTFSKELKELVIKLAELADKDTNKEANNDTADSNAEKALTKLSAEYKTFFLNFLEGYQKWKTCRKQLIRKSTAYANKISFFSRVVSTVRILTSIANILGTLELFPQFTAFWGHPAITNSPAIALGFVKGERIVSHHYQKKAKKFIRKDENVYKDLKKWFGKAKQLDGSVNILFPRGIDKELVRKFDRQSIQGEELIVDESTKLLASIFASNAKDNVGLLEDKSFLDNAVKFATSDAGIQWLHKTLLETDPVAMEIFKLRLSDSSTESDENISSEDKAKVSLCTLLPIPTLKLVLNGVTILSAVLDLWESDCGDSRLLRQLAEKANEDFEATKKVLKFLCPSEIDITNELD